MHGILVQIGDVLAESSSLVARIVVVVDVIIIGIGSGRSLYNFSVLITIFVHAAHFVVNSETLRGSI